MKHMTLPRFWQFYAALPEDVQRLADKNYELLKRDPFHPSLHFKKVGKKKQLWSARVGEHYRVLGQDKPEGVLWFWIGTHAQYDKLLA
jgi:mRNA-degrading endonuclease RelE of RelBE toxin-antitoxin system